MSSLQLFAMFYSISGHLALRLITAKTFLTPKVNNEVADIFGDLLILLSIIIRDGCTSLCRQIPALA